MELNQYKHLTQDKSVKTPSTTTIDGGLKVAALVVILTILQIIIALLVLTK